MHVDSPRIKFYTDKLGLDQIDVFYEDTDVNSSVFNVTGLPSVFSVGKHSFFINPVQSSVNLNDSEFVPILKIGTEIKIEILDSNGNPIFVDFPNADYSFEYIKNELKLVSNPFYYGYVYYPDTSLAISTHVYNDISNGTGKIVIVGELENVPSEWKGVYNVRWKRNININKSSVNKSLLYFFEEPKVNIQEVTTQYMSQSYDSGLTTETEFSGSYEKIQQIVGFSTQYDNIIGDYKNISEDPPYTIIKGSIKKTSGSNFISSMINSEFSCSNPDSNTEINKEFQNGEISYTIINKSYFTKIEEVKNNNEIILYDIYKPEIRIGNSTNTTKIEIPSFKNSPFKIKYNNPVSLKSTEKVKSFAKIRLSKLKIYSGNLEKIEIYTKSKGLQDVGYKLISTQKISDNELFQEDFNKNIGILEKNEDVILNFSGSYYEGITNLINNNLILTHSSEYYLNSLFVSNSIDYSNIKYSKIIVNKEIDFDKDETYSLNFNLIIKNTSNEETFFEIYGSGSAFSNIKNVENTLKKKLYNLNYNVNDNYIFGKFLGKFYLNKNESIKNFENILLNFNSDIEGKGKIIFFVNKGEFTISNLSLKQRNLLGYSPNTFICRVPIKDALQNQINERLDFKFKFYNSDGISSNVELDLSDVKFDGENDVIQGNNNLIPGTIFIGNTIGSGIEMSGVSSGFIRSIGYTGFTSASNGSGSAGFIIYSGSSNLLTNSGDDYKGIGIELVGNSESYFRFKTNPSLLDIRAKTFFVGNKTLQFISGSNNNIEISSSKFHLKPNGDVIIQADLSANSISTPSSGPPYKAQITSEGYAKFTSASIAGFNINEDAFFTNTFLISGSATGNSYFISSSKFNVKASGDITGSSVLFTGGKVGGWNIDNTKLYNNDVEIISDTNNSKMSFKSSNSERLFLGILTQSGFYGNYGISSSITYDTFESSGESVSGNNSGWYISNTSNTSVSKSGVQIINSYPVENNGASYFSMKISGSNTLKIENYITKSFNLAANKNYKFQFYYSSSHNISYQNTIFKILSASNLSNINKNIFEINLSNISNKSASIFNGEIFENKKIWDKFYYFYKTPNYNENITFLFSSSIFKILATG